MVCIGGTDLVIERSSTEVGCIYRNERQALRAREARERRAFEGKGPKRRAGAYHHRMSHAHQVCGRHKC